MGERWSPKKWGGIRKGMFVMYGILVLLFLGCDTAPTTLKEAVVRGDAKAVERILSSQGYTMQMDQSGETPLHLAAVRGYSEVVHLLLKHGALADAKVGEGAWQGWTPMHYAAQEGHAQVVRLLLTYGANINATTGDGATPLHLAIANRSGEVVYLLRKHGAH